MYIKNSDLKILAQPSAVPSHKKKISLQVRLLDILRNQARSLLVIPPTVCFLYKVKNPSISKIGWPQYDLPRSFSCTNSFSPINLLETIHLFLSYINRNFKLSDLLLHSCHPTIIKSQGWGALGYRYTVTCIHVALKRGCVQRKTQ